MSPGSDRVAVESGAATHVGAVRRHNEDSFCSTPDMGLWVVADGMGGAASGDVASALAVSGIEVGTARGQDLVQAITGAHEAIIAAPAKGRGTPGMGSTIVALRVQRNTYELAWVGDSRIYRLRSGELGQLTRDHSLVQDLVEQGEIAASEARSHPQRNIITRALGALSNSAPVVDRREGNLQAGDVFLLCTDGLNGELDDDRIRDILVDGRDPQDAAQRLVAAAVAAGGKDNVTAVVVAVQA